MTKLTKRHLLKGVGASAAALAVTRWGAPGYAAELSDKDLAKPATLRLGHVPLVSSGPIFVALARGYFEKVNLKIEQHLYTDGALAVPALVAGALDLTATTSNAGLFNAISKNAPYKLFADRGQEKPGSGTMSIVVSEEFAKKGVTGLDKFAALKGKRLAIQAPGSIDQYLLGKALRAVKLDARHDVQWQSGIKYPDMVKLMGAGRIDAAEIPVPLSYLAEKKKVGKLIGWGSDIEKNAQLACFAIHNSILQSNFSAAVRFAMVSIYAGREFNRAAASADPKVVEIIHEATKLPAAIIKSGAPHWTWMAEDGMPNVKSVMNQAEFWHSYFDLVPKAVTEAEVFNLAAVKEANRQLARKNPFA
ncbi:MAG TPA: ABC transporter substrate-binding protein [Pseudolabrys sp.]|nr:ABC transporter substrate-binding protein [Pseudolabrys sp.]